MKHKTQGAAVLALVEHQFIVIREPRLSSSEELIEALNCPRGGVDDGESPRNGASRELLEETGIFIEPSRLVFLGYCFADNGSIASPIHLFGVRIERSEWLSRMPVVEQELNPELLDLDQASNLFRSGILTDAITAHLLIQAKLVDQLGQTMEKFFQITYQARQPISTEDLSGLRIGLQEICNPLGLRFEAGRDRLKVHGWAYGDNLTLLRLPTQIEYLAKKAKMVKLG